MAHITRKDVDKIARLAKIEVTDEKKDLLEAQLNSTLSWVETLNEVNTDQVEALTNVQNITLAMHADEVQDGNITEDILKNAPEPKYNYFTVPKVIE